jgi:hypothetical protein
MGTSDPDGAVNRVQTRLEATAARRIYRAYRHLQHARRDGDYRLIMKWKTRVDDLLDECILAGCRRSQQLAGPARLTPCSD